MSALDIGARGLARRVQAAVARIDENGASLAPGSDMSAAALEALSAQSPLLTGVAGTTYTVESPPYLRRQRVVIRGNGAELRNVNATSLNISDKEGVALPLGVSNVWDTEYLTYFAVQSAVGPELVVAAGDESSFAPGDLVIVHGATYYFIESAGYKVYRNYTRARVLAVDPGRLTLDRALPAQLLADSPVIANADEGMPSLIPGVPYYLLYAPHVSGLTLASDFGEAWKWGGIIDGTFRDLEIVGRNGVVFNALQDCLFENIHFRSWRKVCEIAEGSYGTVVRGLRGTLSDASARLGGASDHPTFFIAIGENSAECVLEDLVVDCGPNDIVGDSAVALNTGRNNALRNSQLRFPALTATALRIRSFPAPGHPNVDCGFRDLTVTAPVCSQFFTCNDLGGGVERPYLESSRFYGQPTQRAATLGGRNGRLIENYFENGDLHTGGPDAQNWRIERNTINGSVICWAATGQIIRGNYIRDGFSGLTDVFLRNNTVLDNESDASRRLNAASVLSNIFANVTTTAANAPYATATFAAGDLVPGDKIYFSCPANASWSGTSSRHARLSYTQNGVTVAIGAASVSSPGALLSFNGVIEVRADTILGCECTIGGTRLPTAVIPSSIAAHGLTLNIEFWVSNPSEPIAVRGARIVATKPGMRHLPIT